MDKVNNVQEISKSQWLTCVKRCICGCYAEGLVDVIVYNSPDDPSKFNRGFAFLDYDSHKSASAARRTITSTRMQVWGSEVIVEWAEPQEEPDEETMSKVLYQSLAY